VRGIIDGSIVLQPGHTLAWPYAPIPRYQALLVLMFSVVLIALSYPLLSRRRGLDGIDRTLLLGSLIAFQPRIWIWASSCLLFLAVFRLRPKLRRRRHPAQHRASEAVFRESSKEMKRSVPGVIGNIGRLALMRQTRRYPAARFAPTLQSFPSSMVRDGRGCADQDTGR
jgi:hypothetical protein